MDPRDYLTPEARARLSIDGQLAACGWSVQKYKNVNLSASRGVAVREVVMADGRQEADYVLFVDRRAAGIIEAKKAGTTLTGVEFQSHKYTDSLPPDICPLVLDRPLLFVYESTGLETRFTDALDPAPASRPVFTFHRPETFAGWVGEGSSLRGRLGNLPTLDPKGLWPAQAEAIRNLEDSLRHGRARALIQMATGSGKTFTAANVCYRLVKFADARRILFLVDRSHLGKQTLKEFQAFSTPDDGRKFTELYNVQHLTHNRIDDVARVVVSTIQRLYSILRGDDELQEDLDERSSYELEPTAPVEVRYNARVPIETFDVIIVDECHRSIYGVWRQVLEYFDSFIIGLTATPGKQTFGFFNQNLVMEYNHEQAVADRVNVDFDIYRIATEITGRGSKVEAGLVSKFRDRQTRATRLEKLDQDVSYDAQALDRKVVARDQIRTIIQTFRDKLPEIFSGRTWVPKTLIFAKDDSHADDIVQIVREEFGRGNEFAVKITYKSGSQGQNPDELLQQFRNSANPRIVETVDMIATGTDVKPIECVMFMRMVKSRTFFEQMKGRGVRVINPTELRAVTPDAQAKDHFVIIDAVGVTEADLNDTVPLERKPHVAFERLLQRVALGNRDTDTVSSIAARLARLDSRLSSSDRAELENVAGQSLESITHAIVDSINPDVRLARARKDTGQESPTERDVKATGIRLLNEAMRPIVEGPAFRAKLIEMRRSYEQLIDETSKDVVRRAEFSGAAKERAQRTVDSFRKFIEKHKDEITALQVLYSRPYRARLTFDEVKELASAIARPPYRLTATQVWQAYETLERSKVHGSGIRMLTDIVALVRFALGTESELVPTADRVKQRFSEWIERQNEAGRSFTPEQTSWLERIRDHVGTSIGISVADFDLTPFAEHGGLGRAYQIFGPELQPLLEELNEALAA